MSPESRLKSLMPWGLVRLVSTYFHFQGCITKMTRAISAARIISSIIDQVPIPYSPGAWGKNRYQSEAIDSLNAV